MPGIDYRQARVCLPLAEVLKLLGFEWTAHQRGQVRGPCPVHKSRTPRSRSFAAHLRKTCGIATVAAPGATLWIYGWR
jgi:hypothetical protein